MNEQLTFYRKAFAEKRAKFKAVEKKNDYLEYWLSEKKER
jgi:hypothetical protein